MINAIFFDLYETLVTEHETHRLPVPALASRLGADEEGLRREWNLRRDSIITGRILNHKVLLLEICDSLKCPIKDSLLAELQSERIALKTPPFQRVEPEILNTLRTLRQRRILIGVISNVRPEEVTAWPSCPLSGLVDTAVFSCDVGLLKPDPEIYRLACHRLEVSPEDCLYVGDGSSDELRGASDVKMRPLWASWFLEKWSHWDLDETIQNRSAGFPRLRSISDLTGYLSTTH